MYLCRDVCVDLKYFNAFVVYAVKDSYAYNTKKAFISACP